MTNTKTTQASTAKTPDAKTADAKAAAPGTKPAEAKAEKAPKEKKVTVGSIAMQAIREGKSNEEALAAVKEKKPEAKTTLASIGWYRNKLRSDGEKTVDGKEIPTARAVKGPAEPKEKAAAKTKEKAPAATKEVDPLD